MPDPRTLLLIDDDPTFLRHARRYLERDGALAVGGTATSVREGLALARALRPDLVVVDLSMTEADGFSAIPALREVVPEAAVVVLTMLEDDRYRQRALGLGADAFVPKGRLVEELRSEIARLLRLDRPASAPAEPSFETAPPLHTMDPQFPPRATTGVTGLDQILRGGLPVEELFVLQGGPGTGKTTIGLQFLQAGVALGERVLYLTLSQTATSLRAIGASHGWTLEGVEIREFRDPDGDDGRQTIFHSTEVELEETLGVIRQAVEDSEAQRVVIDTVADLRVLAGDPTRYRRELLALRRFFHAHGCTALLLDDTPEQGGDHELQNQSHGVIELCQESPEYGDVRRSLQVVKMRATPFLSGFHNFTIETGGLTVYPRLTVGGSPAHDDWEAVGSGLPALDQMLGGGLREGTACLVAGPTGAGKTAVAYQYAYAAAERGEKAAVFLFNERMETFAMRARSLGMPLEDHAEAGRLAVHQVNTGGTTPSQFGQQVRAAVEEGGARVVVIDSLSGYINAMLHRHLLVSQMHELVTFLSQRGVLTLLVADQSGALGAQDPSGPAHVSYLADSVLLLRYAERGGRRVRTISVLKQRHGEHALEARELHLTARGLAVGEPADGFVGFSLEPPIYATFYPVNGALNEHAPDATTDGA